MKRRDFSRLVLAAGASSAFAKSSLAQMSAEETQNPPAKSALPSIHHQELATYLQPSERSTEVIHPH